MVLVSVFYFYTESRTYIDDRRRDDDDHRRGGPPGDPGGGGTPPGGGGGGTPPGGGPPPYQRLIKIQKLRGTLVFLGTSPLKKRGFWTFFGNKFREFPLGVSPSGVRLNFPPFSGFFGGVPPPPPPGGVGDPPHPPEIPGDPPRGTPPGVDDLRYDPRPRSIFDSDREDVKSWPKTPPTS